MIKRIGLVRRKTTLSHEAFVDHWLNTHAELCKKLPGMRRYCVNLIKREDFPDLDYDGFSELWFDSEAELEAAFESPEGKTLLADLPNFIEEIYPVVVTEHQKLWPG